MPKCIVVGEACVGKSSLIDRYFGLDFNPTYKATMGVNLHSEELKGDSLWELTSQPQFKPLLKEYRMGAQAGMMVCDYTRRCTMEYSHGLPNDRVMLVVNKSDIPVVDRAFSSAEFIQYAKDHGVQVALETSALNNENVTPAFDFLHLLASQHPPDDFRNAAGKIRVKVKGPNYIRALDE